MSSKALKLDLNRRDHDNASKIKTIDLSSLIEGIVQKERDCPNTKKYKPGELKLAIWETINNQSKTAQSSMTYTEITKIIDQVAETNYHDADQLFKDLLKMKFDALESELSKSVNDVLGQLKFIFQLRVDFDAYFQSLRPLFVTLESKFVYCESQVNHLEKLANQDFINFFCSPPVQDQLKTIYSSPELGVQLENNEKKSSDAAKMWLNCIEMDLGYSNLMHFQDIQARFVEEIESKRDQFFAQTGFWTEFFLSVINFNKSLLKFYNSFNQSHYVNKIEAIFIDKFFTDQMKPESKLWQKNFQFNSEAPEFGADIKTISEFNFEHHKMSNELKEKCEQTILKYYSKSARVVMVDLEKDLNCDSNMKAYVAWIRNWIKTWNDISKSSPMSDKYEGAIAEAVMTPLTENEILVSQIGANFCSEVIKGRIKFGTHIDLKHYLQYFAPNKEVFTEELCKLFERRIEKSFADGTDYDKLIAKPFKDKIQKSIESSYLSSQYGNLEEGIEAGKRYCDDSFRILLLNRGIWKFKNDDFKFPEEMISKFSQTFENFKRYDSYPLAMHGSVEFEVNFPKNNSSVHIRCLPIHAALIMYVVDPLTIDDLSEKTNMSGEDLLPHLRMLCNRSIISTSLNENDLTLYFLNPDFQSEKHMIDFFKK